MASTKYRRHIKRRRVEASEDDDSSNVILFKLEPGKRYAHTAACTYQIMMASLQPDDRRLPNCACNMINKARKQSEYENKVIVILEHDLKEYMLCILDSGKLQQCKLNLIIKPGEQMAFRTLGKIPVQLTGVSSEAH